MSQVNEITSAEFKERKKIHREEKKDAPTGCGSRAGRGCTARKHPSVQVKHSRCCNKKQQKKQLTNKQLEAEISS